MDPSRGFDYSAPQAQPRLLQRWGAACRKTRSPQSEQQVIAAMQDFCSVGHVMTRTHAPYSLRYSKSNV